jgi:4'-phosphopantetheinyl transferase-like protein/4'-phosphopantetheinyl transferase superfamily protein
MTEPATTFLEVWRNLLPKNVKVGAGAITNPPLGVCSSLLKGDMSSDRISEFYSGRLFAKEALALFGFPGADLAVGYDRRPVWPAGYIGSITHTRKSTRGFCAAAVARAEEWSAIGIDAEFIGAITATDWPTILTGSELGQIKALPPNEREPEVTRRWCVKEAAVKAAQLRLEPLGVETTEHCAGWYGFSHAIARLKDWRVRTALWNGVVCAAVAAPL